MAAGRVDDQHEANGLAGDRKPCWNQGDQEAPPWPGSQRRSQRMRLGLQHQLWLGLPGQRRLELHDQWLGQSQYLDCLVHWGWQHREPGLWHLGHWRQGHLGQDQERLGQERLEQGQGHRRLGRGQGHLGQERSGQGRQGCSGQGRSGQGHLERRLRGPGRQRRLRGPGRQRRLRGPGRQQHRGCLVHRGWRHRGCLVHHGWQHRSCLVHRG